MNKAVRHFKDALYLREPRTDIDIYKNKYILILYEFFTNPKWHNIMILMSLLFIS